MCKIRICVCVVPTQCECVEDYVCVRCIWTYPGVNPRLFFPSFSPFYFIHANATNVMACYSLFVCVSLLFILLLVCFLSITWIDCFFLSPFSSPLHPSGWRIFCCFLVVLLFGVVVVAAALFLLGRRSMQITYIHIHNSLSLAFVCLLFRSYTSNTQIFQSLASLSLFFLAS